MDDCRELLEWLRRMECDHAPNIAVWADSLSALIAQTESMPTPDECAQAADAYGRLDRFECTARAIRGYGAFDPSTLPIHGCKVVMAWLRSRAAQNNSPLPAGEKE
jgi:hypothetical protein